MGEEKAHRQGAAEPALEVRQERGERDRGEPVAGEGRRRIDRLRGDPAHPGDRGQQVVAEGSGRALGARLCRRFVGPPDSDRLQLAGEEGLAAGLALDLAARRLGQPAGGQEDDLPGIDLVLLDQPLADVAHHGVEVRRRFGLDLVDDDEALLALRLQGEGRPAAGPERRMALFDRELQVLRVAVDALEDDEILESPGDEELAVAEESQVAGAEVRPLAGIGGIAGITGTGEPRLEDLGALLGPRPIAGGDARPLNPDFADLVGRPAGERLGIDDRDLLPGKHGAAADHPAGFHASIDCGIDFDHPVTIELGARERQHPGRLEIGVPRDVGGALREPEGGIERRAAKAVGAEGGDEAVEGLGAHRLGAVEGEAQARKIEPGALLGRDPAGAEVVGEIGSEGGARAVAGDRLQPPHRPADEGFRRQQDGRRPLVERLQHAEDQAEVVKQGKPGDARGERPLPEAGEGRQVVHRVAVVDHDAPRRPRRARGVHEKSEVVGGGAGGDPRRRVVLLGDSAVFEVVGPQPDEVRQVRRTMEERLRRGEHGGGGQGHPGF